MADAVVVVVSTAINAHERFTKKVTGGRKDGEAVATAHATFARAGSTGRSGVLTVGDCRIVVTILIMVQPKLHGSRRGGYQARGVQFGTLIVVERFLRIVRRNQIQEILLVLEQLRRRLSLVMVQGLRRHSMMLVIGRRRGRRTAATAARIRRNGTRAALGCLALLDIAAAETEGILALPATLVVLFWLAEAI